MPRGKCSPRPGLAEERGSGAADDRRPAGLAWQRRGDFWERSPVRPLAGWLVGWLAGSPSSAQTRGRQWTFWSLSAGQRGLGSTWRGRRRSS
ncbi:zinc finger protein OZF isoform X5 [Cricetulus griseus]|uniref:Zinc finger protein OZF isoform X5 n=1 Tax=Cricetulus griseus TaxID=10029 RepID=A0A9J7KBC9_CRIGR|nr:zinc finger protein OZF isoform X5 [Cricetulus griseus]XP_035305171.1 zinc finger protein OZF isoform X5 [Cricetulus griseus]